MAMVVPTHEAVPPHQGWLEMKANFGYNRRFCRLENGTLLRWHNDVTVPLADTLKSLGIGRAEETLRDLGATNVRNPARVRTRAARLCTEAHVMLVQVVQLVRLLTAEGGQEARAQLGLDEAEDMRLESCLQHFAKAMATQRKLQMRECRFEQVDDRRFCVRTPAMAAVLRHTAHRCD